MDPMDDLMAFLFILLVIFGLGGIAALLFELAARWYDEIDRGGWK